MRTKHAAEIRRGISDAKAFVAKAHTISAGYIFFESRDDTPHGGAFQRTLRRLNTSALYHRRKKTSYTDGSASYVNRLYAKAPSHLSPDWDRA